MSTLASLERRLAALEKAVARLEHSQPPPAGQGVAAIVGSMNDFPEFDEVLKLGRRYREGLLSPDQASNGECTDA